MEVKIGVQHAPRELSIDTELSQEQVLDQLTNPGSDGVLKLSDTRGRTIAVPIDKVSYLSFAEENIRKVGFGN